MTSVNRAIITVCSKSNINLSLRLGNFREIRE